MSLKEKVNDLYSRLVGRTFTATYEGERRIKSTKISRHVVAVEDTEAIVEDLGDILHALENTKNNLIINHMMCAENAVLIAPGLQRLLAICDNYVLDPVWPAISKPDSYHVYATEVQEGDIGDTSEYEISEFKLFSCKDWDHPKYTAGVNFIVRKCD